jgi:glucose dehydrogenase
VTVDDQRLLDVSDQTDADWIMFGQDYRNQRFSTLRAIDRSNVAHLQPLWVYQSGLSGRTRRTHWSWTAWCISPRRRAT